jgi:hypothetical protein
MALASRLPPQGSKDAKVQRTLDHPEHITVEDEGQNPYGEMLETPFLLRHVESHLIFGPLSRIPPAAGRVILPTNSLVTWLGLRRLTPRQQAILGWIATQIMLGLFSFLALTALVPMKLMQGSPDVWSLLFLALVWMRSIEFLPQVTPHQRYVTLARLALSIPLAYFS